MTRLETVFTSMQHPFFNLAARVFLRNRRWHTVIHAGISPSPVEGGVDMFPFSLSSADLLVFEGHVLRFVLVFFVGFDHQPPPVRPCMCVCLSFLTRVQQRRRHRRQQQPPPPPPQWFDSDSDSIATPPYVCVLCLSSLTDLRRFTSATRVPSTLGDNTNFRPSPSPPA